MQLLEELPPVPENEVPPLQLVQFSEELLPTMVEKVPYPQLVHKLVPWDDEYVPATHEIQEEAPDEEYYPG